MKNDKRTFYLFITPAIIAFVIVMVIPFCLGIFYSLTDWNGISKDFAFVGLENYGELLTDVNYQIALGKTFLFAFLSVITINVIGLGFALLVTTKLKSRNFLRVSFFFPNLIGGLILGFVWQFIFTQAFQFIGQTFVASDFFFFDWLTTPVSAFLAMVFVTTWKQAGYVMVIYIAAIQSIPNEVLEAAKVDGASAIATFIRVKLPLIMSGFTVSLFVTLSNAFKVYDLNLSLTSGGPMGKTVLASMDIYNEAFGSNNFAYGQSKAIILFAVIALISVIQVNYTKSREVEL